MRARQLLQPDHELVEHVENGVLGGGELLLDLAAGVAAQGRIGDHPAVGGEDVGVLRAQPYPCLGLVQAGRALRSVQTPVQPFELRSDRLGRD